MNNIKLFMLLIMAATSSVAIADGGTWTFSESNGTLTITASGDLTTASQSTTYKVFTSSAVGNVFTDNTGTNVVQGNTYNAGTTYYQAQRAWTPLFTSNNNVPTTEGNYAYSISETYKWKESTAGATGVYFYSAYLSEEKSNYRYSIPENTYFYSFNPPQEIWKSGALTEGAKMYHVTYSSRQWNTQETSGKYIYKVQYQSNGSYQINRYDPVVNENGGQPEESVTIKNDQTSYEYVYIYTTTKLTWDDNDYSAKTVTIGTNAEYVTSGMITEVHSLTIGDQVNMGSSENEVQYSDPATFTYDDSQYYRVVIAANDQTKGTEIALPLDNGTNISLVSNIDQYHEQSSKVYATRIQNTDQCYGTLNVNGTFTYNSTNYLLYATSNTEVSNGFVALSSLNLYEATDANKTTVSGYVSYDSKFKVNSNGWNTRYTNQDYSQQSAITYDGTSYAGYVKLSSAYNSGTTYYVGDEGVSLITESELKSTYLDGTITYYASSNLYRSTDNGTTKTLLTAGQQYTYSTGDTFYTPAATEYVAITNNAEYFGTGGTGESYITDHTETLTFQEALRLKILSDNYTKVEFDNTGSGELTIDPEIVRNIIAPDATPDREYRSYMIQASLVELDLGEATTASFDNMFNITYGDGSKAISTNLATLTLPKTTVSNGVMTVPTGVVSLYKNGDKLRTVKVPEGYTKIGNNAFEGNSITTVNLPNSLTEIGDEAFMNCGSLKYINSSSTESQSIKFPSANLTTIGKSAFAGCTSLTSTESDPFILPESLTTIKASAFVSLKGLKFLKLNDNLEYVGNTAFGLDNASLYDQTTITFPSTIKYLGPGSFVGRMYQDIYFTGTTAPVCPVGKPAFNWGNVTAFSANIQMGNNGFASESDQITGSTADSTKKGYANRENYINNGYYFTILHFPEGLSNDQAKTYRDITRRYVTRTGNAQADDGNFYYGGSIAGYTDPATGKTFGEAFQEGTTSAGKSKLVYYMSSDGLLTESACADNLQPGYVDTYMGTQQIWPSQMQWTRNFVTVANGVEWDGKTVYEPTLLTDADLQKIFEWMKEDGLYVKANSLDYTAGNPRVPNSNDNSQGGVEFSLANKTNYASLSDVEKDYFKLILYQGTRRFVLSYDGGYDIPFKINLKGGRWWSICLPFNMTKAEVDEVLGGKNEGTHVCLMSGVDRTVSESGNTLVLKFKNDVYRHKTVRTVTEASDGKSFTYTYEKNFNESNDAPGDNDIVIYARESYMIYPVRVDAGTNPVEYDFGSPVFETGNPLPTIVYSNSDAPYTTQHESYPAYRFIGNFTTSTGNDAQGKAITIKIPQYSYAYGRENAQATKSKFFILSTAGATWSPFKSIVQNTAGGNTDWVNFFEQNHARVNQVSLFGDDEEVTGIDNVIIEVSSDNDEDLRVFNLNGSMMGNSLQGLPAGTYIQGGKAYRVK